MGYKLLSQKKKFSIGIILSITIFFLVAYLPKILTAKILPIDSLPTWEVINPVSTLFVMDKIPRTKGSLAAGDSTVPNECLIDPAIDTLFLLMQSRGIYFCKTATNPSGMVGSSDFVVIKGNFQWNSRNTTSTDRIKGVIWQILQHPDGFTGEILVCDNTQNSGTGINHNDNNSEDTEQSVIDVVNTFYSKGYPVYLLDWNYVWDAVAEEYSTGDYSDGFVYEPASKISYPKFTSPSGNYFISLRYGIWDQASATYDLDRLCIIDFPVLKAHAMAGATIAVKNWTGVLTTAYPEERYGGSGPMHYNYFFGQYALLAKVMSVTFPKLTIVDAEWTSGSGPNNLQDTVHTRILLGSTDPCAVSWYAAKYILTPVAVDPNNTDPDLPGSNYHNNLTAWTNCLRDSGFAVTIDSSEISVYNLEVLPVELVSFIAKVNDSKIQLNWQTATEVNNYGFNVERRINEGEWNSIGFVEGHGNSNSPKEYSFIDKDLFAGGSNFQYRLKQIDTDGQFEYSDVVEVEIVPTQFELSQNYPNPFNPSTTINFSLPQATQIKIYLYNIVGEKIATLAEGMFETGNHKITFNASSASGGLPSGAYIYRIESSDFVQVKKMILMK